MTDVVAIDANLFLRHTVRRFLCAMQEMRGGQVLVPAEVLRESVRKYPRIVGRHAARVVERRAVEEWGRGWTPEQRSEIEGRTRIYGRGLAKAFEVWTQQERRRNDAAWSVSEETEAASDLAMDLTASGAFRDDAGYGDPLVVAQSLMDGARIIATDNRASIDPEKLHAWIEEHRSDTRLARAKLPFLVTPEQAWRAGIEGGTEDRREWRTTLLAFGTCRPRKEAGTQRALEILARFERQLTYGGMQGAAAAIREERMRWLGSEEEMVMELKTQAPDPSVTRSAEERRIEAERESAGKVGAGPPAPAP